MKAEITFDLVMDDDMQFVEGCHRFENRTWEVFMFRKSKGIWETGIKKDLVWESGVRGINVIVPDDTILDKSIVLDTLSDALAVTEWVEVRGPDSMRLR